MKPKQFKIKYIQDYNEKEKIIYSTNFQHSLDVLEHLITNLETLKLLNIGILDIIEIKK